MYSVSQIFTQILHGWSYFFSYIITTECILDIEDVHESKNIGLKKELLMFWMMPVTLHQNLTFTMKGHMCSKKVYFFRGKNIEEKQCKYSIKGENPSKKQCILM